jgi:hypothetical protein
MGAESWDPANEVASFVANAGDSYLVLLRGKFIH